LINNDSALSLANFRIFKSLRLALPQMGREQIRSSPKTSREASRNRSSEFAPVSVQQLYQSMLVLVLIVQQQLKGVKQQIPSISQC